MNSEHHYTISLLKCRIILRVTLSGVEGHQAWFDSAHHDTVM